MEHVAQASHSSAIEGRSIDYVPKHERSAKLRHQGPFWFVGNFHFLTVSIGFVGPAMGLSAGWTTLAGALGIMFGTVFMAFHGSQGPEMGLPQMIQSRAQFGYRGVVLALVAALFVFFGINVVNVALIVEGVHNILGYDSKPVGLVAIAIGALLAIYGHDAMHRAFKWSLYATLPVYVIVTVLAMTHTGGGAAGTPMPNLGFNWVAFLTQFAVSASYNIGYAPYVSDYTRYLPADTRRKPLIAAVFVGASLSGAWMIALGASLAQSLSATNVLSAIYGLGNATAPGFGALLVTVAVVGFVPIIALNTYSATLTVLTGADCLKPMTPGRRARVTTIVAISVLLGVCILMLKGGGLNLLNLFLTTLLYFLVPWTAVNLVDYFFVRKGHYVIPHFFRPDGIYGSWQATGIAAYLIGFAAMIPFFSIFDPSTGKAVFVGFIAQRLHEIDIAWLVGLIVSGGVYYRLSRKLDLVAERALVRAHESV
ncbi:allantoin permease [Burkholderia lata]|uniref:purine-cytosine permease family protein n=1 Tax=Burkholderia lata (strain ATCC 17760 / DSM 23089 / LMG 22485 / NCIMB 9086 / R18194 / 383) TaxID=482957 RepID=UPI0014538C3D|nr:cytosine permease [Burkholderia lata]VWB18897.1 allantoin permease [Burkholderia lata]